MKPHMIWCWLAIACAALAHKMCDVCIPLEDLLTPGYGVSVSMDGLSSAVAYHNGTVSAVSFAAASEQFHALMSAILAQHQTNQQYSAMVTYVAPRSRVLAMPWDKDILKLVRSYARRLLQSFRTACDHSSPVSSPPLDPVTQIYQAQFLALEPFASMDAELRSQISPAIQLPAWFMSSPYARNLLEAACTIFDGLVGVESPSSAAYTALGYELCRVDHDAFDCTGPGRLATLVYDGQYAIASVTRTPISITSRTTLYSVLRSVDPVELSKWIDSFLNATAPDMITLAGTNADTGTFAKALALSKAAGHLELHDSLDAQLILVVGAAQVAKDALENHDSDCGEFPECLDIRAEADRLAGEYVYTPRPRTWPATNSRHWREWEERPGPATLDHIPSMLPSMLQNKPEL